MAQHQVLGCDDLVSVILQFLTSRHKCITIPLVCKQWRKLALRSTAYHTLEGSIFVEHHLKKLLERTGRSLRAMYAELPGYVFKHAPPCVGTERTMAEALDIVQLVAARPNITRLGEVYSAEHMEMLVKCLPLLDSVRTIIGLGEKDVEALWPVLPRLRKLRVGFDATMEVVEPVLFRCPLLRSLSMRFDLDNTCQMLNLLAKNPNFCPELDSLVVTLRANCTSDEAERVQLSIVAVLEAKGANLQSLRLHIFLRNCETNSLAVTKAIADHCGSGKLHTLAIRSHRQTVHCAQLREMFRAAGRSLLNLDLRGQFSISDLAFAALLEHCLILQRLQLAVLHSLDDHGMAQLAMSGCAPHLVWLNLQVANMEGLSEASAQEFANSAKRLLEYDVRPAACMADS